MSAPALSFERPAQKSASVSSAHVALAVLAQADRFDALKAALPGAVSVSGLSVTDALNLAQRAPLIIEQGVEGYDQLLLSLAVEQPKSAVIVISDHLPAHIVRALMKLESSDILPPSASASDILQAVDKLREVQAETHAPHSAVCWAFRGAVGGAGVSTIAIETAFELVRRAGKNKVCLVDLNVADGMVTSFLDCVPKLDLQALSDAPERLDQTLLSAWCHEHDSGLKLIAAKRNPEADALANEAAVLRLLDVACMSFDFVLIDVPRHYRPWTKSVLAAADETIIVSELTVPSLHAAADMCRDIDIWRADAQPTRLILNRMFAKKRFRAEFPVARAEKAIERKIDATVTSDWDAARTAVNFGKPVAEVKPKSLLVADIVKLVDSWAPALGQASDVKRKAKA